MNTTERTQNQIKKPLIRWAGGKRAITSSLLSALPRKYGCYFEPMLGGGALFFSICPDTAIIADINPELVNFYSVIKHSPHEFTRAVEELRALKTIYMGFRKSSPTGSLERAVRFFYLIRLSWNGIYRVNRKGEFNVPFGGRRPRTLVTPEAVISTSEALKRTQLRCGDFETTTRDVKAGDLVYLDPPYPKGADNNNGFDRYHETRFTVEEHTRLADYAEKLADRGAYVIITEAGSADLIALYGKRFNIRVITSRSLIAADSASRGTVYEAIITSYTASNSETSRPSCSRKGNQNG